MSRAIDNLRNNQRQLDMDGVEVGVSRQAVNEAVEEYAELLTALEKSVELQSRYAGLLNMYDAGTRMEFSTAAEWIARLQHLRWRTSCT